MIWGWDGQILVGYLRLGLVLLALFSWMSWMPWAREPAVRLVVWHFSETNKQMQKLTEMCECLMIFTLNESGKSNHRKLPMKSRDSKVVQSTEASQWWNLDTPKIPKSSASSVLWGSSRQMSASGGGNQDFGSANVSPNVGCFSKCWESLPACSDWMTQEYAQTLNQLLLEPAPQFLFGDYNWHVSKSLMTGHYIANHLMIRRARLIDFQVGISQDISSEVYCAARTWLCAPTVPEKTV